MATDRLLKINQVAFRLRVSKTTVLKYIKKNLIHAVKLPIKGWRIPTSEVTRILQSKPL
jgi:excisionase family DNA binding protein